MPRTINKQNTVIRLDAFEDRDSFTRPADTNPYEHGDALSDHVEPGSASNLEFNNLTLSPSGFISLSSVVVTSTKGGTPPNLEVWLFSIEPAAQADSEPYSLTQDENENARMISLFGGSDSASNWYVEASDLNRRIKLSDETPMLFGQLRIVGGYTPDASEIVTVRLIGESI